MLTLKEVERKYIIHALVLHRHNMSKTAKVLGIGRTTLYRKCKEYNIKVRYVKS